MILFLYQNKMSKIIIIGDLHIEEKAIEELKDIFQEIFSYKADAIIQLGDFYEKNKPSPLELDFGTFIAKQMKEKYKDVTILDGTGKHSILNGEHATRYLQHLGIRTVGIEHKLEVDGLKLFLGHLMLHESKLMYGIGRYGVKDLNDYDYVLLAHQHSPQVLVEGKMFHIGSVRFQNFNEASDPYKQIAILENGVLTFIPLKSPTPMIDLVTGDNPHYLEDYLPKVEAKSKVRVVISSFSIFKNSLETIKKYKNKFVEFKVKLDFNKSLTTNKVEAKKENNNLDEIMLEEIKKIRDRDVRELLEAQFKEE